MQNSDSKADLVGLPALSAAQCSARMVLEIGSAALHLQRMALHWRIRSPDGQIYETENVQSWCKKNEHLFLPDARPESKLPLWRRACGGLHVLNAISKPQYRHWRGWTIVSVSIPEGPND